MSNQTLRYPHSATSEAMFSAFYRQQSPEDKIHKGIKIGDVETYKKKTLNR